MPLCGIISSESLGMLPAVWAKECENLLEVTVVTGCDTQLEQQATRGHKGWQRSGEAPRWIGADSSAPRAGLPCVLPQASLQKTHAGGAQQHPDKFLQLLRVISNGES